MKISSLVAACGLTLAVAAVPAFAQIGPYKDFCVNETNVTGYAGLDGILGGTLTALRTGVNGCASQTASEVGTRGFTSDYLNGGYVERFNVAGGGTTFAATIVANWGDYKRDEGATSVVPTALQTLYQLYAVVEASGAVIGGGVFAPITGSIKLYLREGLTADLDLDSINATTLAYTGNAGEILLATADYATGSGVTNAGTLRFQIGFDDFTLTTAGDTGSILNGDQFFIAPRPFHVSVFSDGDISLGSISGPALWNGLAPFIDGAYVISAGDLSAVFQDIPEPATLALSGLALLGLAASRRRIIKS